LEFTRTVEIIGRVLPRPPAIVADVGGGPGQYSAWLAARGYRVEHRDRVLLHVEQVRAARHANVTTAVGDARALDLPDNSVDVVLLLGPLYHLLDRGDRVRALSEARRIVRPAGQVVIAAISRWAARLDGILTERLDQTRPNAVELITASESDGILPPLAAGSFGGYTHRPHEFAGEVRDAGLVLDDLVGVEGLPLATSDLAERLADPLARRALLDSARAVERVPELLGLSSHLIATAYKPETPAT
jgi:SAM-dependent methyltransferase